MLANLRVLVTSQEWLNEVLTTPLIEAAGRTTHEQWLKTKILAVQDPSNPYQGYGPQRVKVRDLDPAQRENYDISPGSAEDADVFHPLHLPYDQLSVDARSKNAVPMVVLCNALGDFILPAGSELVALERALESFLAGSNAQLVLFLRKMQHLAYVGSQVRTGVRAYGDAPATDFVLYETLPPEIQDLDETTLRPVAETLLAQLHNPCQLAWQIGGIDGNRIVRGTTVAELAAILEHPDFTKLEELNMTTAPNEPAFWTQLTELFKDVPAVGKITYQGVGPRGTHLVKFEVRDNGARTAGLIGRALAAFKEVRPDVPIAIGDVDFSANPDEWQAQLPDVCPVCGVSWLACSRKSDHQYDARRAMANRY